MSEIITFTSEEITHILGVGFAAPLIITTICFIVYGINIYQVVDYYHTFGKRDPLLTKAWVLSVMIMNSASSFYQVYYEWIFSITSFEANTTDAPSVASGNVVVLYSVVVMLVQLFWLLCLHELMETRFKAWITISISMASILAFALSIVVGVLSTTMPGPNGTWPTPLISIYLRCVLGLDLGVDTLILIAVLTRLAQMRKSFAHIRKTFSKLSRIYITMTTCSTVIMIVELIINAPQPGNGGGWIPIVITFAPLIGPIYTAGMLSILNARGEIWPQKPDSSEEEQFEDEENRENQRPQMNFTNEVYSRAADRDSRQLAPQRHAATEPANDIEREGGSKRSSVEDCDDQRRYSNDGNADQIQSTQFGIQTI